LRKLSMIKDYLQQLRPDTYKKLISLRPSTTPNDIIITLNRTLEDSYKWLSEQSEDIDKKLDDIEELLNIGLIEKEEKDKLDSHKKISISKAKDANSSLFVDNNPSS